MSMSRNRLFISIVIALASIAGCSSATDSCDGMCSANAICVEGECVPRCSEEVPCAGKDEVCRNGLCVDGRPDTTVPVGCEAALYRCSEDLFKVLVCTRGGVFVEYETCLGGKTCEDGVCVQAACQNGTFRCHESNVEECRNHSYVIYTQCDDSQVCDPSSFECVEPRECEEASRRCLDGNVQICTSGRWVGYRTCPEGMGCDSSTLLCAPAAVCLTDARRCNGDAYERCVNGQWKLESCPGLTVCEGNGECVVPAECVSGATRCVSNEGGDSVQTCVSGSYQLTARCTDGQTCETDASGRASCKAGSCVTAYRCDNNVLYECKEGSYIKKQECGIRQTCSVVSGACDENCGNGILESGEECDTDVMPSGTSCGTIVGAGYEGDLTCTSSCTIDKTACRQTCQGGQTQCSGTVYRVCTSGNWVTTDCGVSGQLCDVDRGGCYSASASWDYVQGFEGFKYKSTYNGNAVEDTLHGVKFSFVGRVLQSSYSGEKDLIVEGSKSVVMTKRLEYENVLTVEGITKGVKTLAFDWRAYATSDVGTYVVTVGDVSDEVSLEGKTGVQGYEHVFNVSGATTIEIKPKVYEGKSNASRIVIDNMRWTNR